MSASLGLVVCGIHRHEWPDTSDYTYNIAQPSTSPWDSFYPNLPADLEMEISGWEVQGAVRKYGWVDDGSPMALCICIRHRQSVSISADETFREVNFDPDTVFAASISSKLTIR